MRKRRKAFILIGITVSVSIALFLMRPSNDEPSYQGKSVSDWLSAWYASDLTNGNTVQRELSISAIRRMGTNALPVLVRHLQYEPSSWWGSVGRLPTGLALRIMGSALARATLVRRLELKQRAMLTLQELGTNAVSAIPELKRIMADKNRPDTAPAAALILSQMGTTGFDELVKALDNTNTPFRFQILNVIGTGSAPIMGTNVCLPRIVAALQDSDPSVRIVATNMLTYLTGNPAASRKDTDQTP